MGASSSNAALAESVRAFVLKGFHPTFGHARQAGAHDAVWQRMRDAGSRLWLDTGDIEEAAGLWVKQFDALTTNNTLLNKEVQKGLYDRLVREAASVVRAAAPGIGRDDLLLELAFILNAYHALRLVERFDAMVSVELHTGLAHDVERSVAYGQRYFAICPERFIVKIPLTPAGFFSARKLGAAGIPINFTLGYSARQNYLAALLARPVYVNVFLGRLNAFVKDHGLGDGENVGEKAVLATQRALLDLRAHGRSKTQLIGASIRSGDQVRAIAGVDVLTMPPAAAAQFRKSGAEGAVVSRVADDPAVALAAGMRLQDFGAPTLWELAPEFRRCADTFAAGNVEAAGPDELCRHFEKAGIGNLFPRWSPEQHATIAADGKIPKFATWSEPLKAGAIGLDALMNASGLHSFAKDQKALDDRVIAQLA
jgi:transaldolase